MKYRSGLERKVADLMTSLEVTFEYETTKIPYVIEHNYIPDFILPTGIMLECKGLWEPEDRRKMLAVMKQNPELDIRMVFLPPYNKISKKSKTTYAQFCERHGIKWTSFAEIPVDWLT